MKQTLSPRQAQVLDLVAQGLENTEIAERLAVSLPTVKVHLAFAYAKIGAINRAHAAAITARGGAL